MCVFTPVELRKTLALTAWTPIIGPEGGVGPGVGEVVGAGDGPNVETEELCALEAIPVARNPEVQAVEKVTMTDKTIPNGIARNSPKITPPTRPL